MVHAYRCVLHDITAVHLTIDGCMAMSPLEVAIVQCYNNSYCLEILKEETGPTNHF